MTVLESDSELRDLISSVRTIAVVGLSPKANRDSHRVAKYLKEQGFTIIPVNPNADEVLGETSYPALEDVPHPVDLVNVFRRSEHTPEIARDAVKIGARAIWMQIDVVNDEAARIASEGGLHVVMDKCLMVKHGMLMR
jgi:uncharacterized protein